MQFFELTAHPDFPPNAIHSVTVEIDIDPDEATLWFQIEGKEALQIPPLLSPGRADGLWRTTCFELFAKVPDDNRYFEFNFSPSGKWAAYSFDGYRANMRDLELSVPPHVFSDEGGWDVDVDFSELPHSEMRIGIAAVLEEIDGSKSYWALAHAPGPPDFHNPDCFIATLPAPEAA